VFGDIGDPELIRARSAEVTINQVTGSTHRNEVSLPTSTLGQAAQLQLLHD
jgi:hypothetical protein